MQRGSKKSNFRGARLVKTRWFAWWADEWTLVREIPFSSVPPSNSLVSDSDPLRTFWAGTAPIKCPRLMRCVPEMQKNKDTCLYHARRRGPWKPPRTTIDCAFVESVVVFWSLETWWGPGPIFGPPLPPPCVYVCITYCWIDNVGGLWFKTIRPRNLFPMIFISSWSVKGCLVLSHSSRHTSATGYKTEGRNSSAGQIFVYLPRRSGMSWVG